MVNEIQKLSLQITKVYILLLKVFNLTYLQLIRSKSIQKTKFVKDKNEICYDSKEKCRKRKFKPDIMKAQHL